MAYTPKQKSKRMTTRGLGLNIWDEVVAIVTPAIEAGIVTGTAAINTKVTTALPTSQAGTYAAGTAPVVYAGETTTDKIVKYAPYIAAGVGGVVILFIIARRK